MKLHKGDHFLHSKVLDPQALPKHEPQEFVVTKISQGQVYIRAYYGEHEDGSAWVGSVSYFPVEQTSRWVLEIL